MIDISDEEIEEAQRHCQAANPDYPFTWTRGYAEAYLRGKREIERRVKDISGQSGLKDK